MLYTVFFVVDEKSLFENTGIMVRGNGNARTSFLSTVYFIIFRQRVRSQ
jgi:hypothetical protein